MRVRNWLMELSKHSDDPSRNGKRKDYGNLLGSFSFIKQWLATWLSFAGHKF